MKRMASCCFTGHRPEKLKDSAENIRRKLKRAIEDAIEDGFIIFISGMARGIDLWAAELVIEQKQYFPQIQLICAILFRGFEQGWSRNWQEQYNKILREADKVYYLSAWFSKEVYQIRNEWMINHASMVIAYYSGIAGGTRNTLVYAQKQKDYIIRMLDVE